MKGSRVACVTIPNFAIEACLREHPELVGQPLALADSDLETAGIIALNREAAHAGVLIAMTVAQGHTVCSHLTVRTRDVEQEIAVSNGLYKKLQSLSPFVEEAEPGLYYLDISGFGLLYKNDQHLAHKISETVTPLGYPIQMGIANNKFVARVAARESAPGAYTIVPDGKEREYLRPLPVARLELPDDIADTLHDLGIKTIRQLAGFPGNELTRRFGPRGAALSRLARGDDTAFFKPGASGEPLTERVWLTASIYRDRMIAAQTEALLASLLVRLGRFCQGCSTVEIMYDLDNRERLSLTVTVESPSLTPVPFLRQLRLQLETTRLVSPVCGITVTIPAVASLTGDQLPLGDDMAGGCRVLREDTVRKQQEIAHTIITVPLPRDTFLPEQRFEFARLIRPHPRTTPVDARAIYPYAAGRINGLRLLQPPREIGVAISGPQATMTVTFRQPVTAKYRGPWELSGGWWAQGFDRLYYEIQTARHRQYLIYFDRTAAQWFLQGVFD
ncbi:MAG: DNA polymerase Y family protein [candidate division Zixibacteria bacterium]|nr:DNA polymerase Y family protein [candidate division Zixibacteria bacterium]